MLRFEPEYVSTIWGGRRFAERFSRSTPAGAVGESWELVDFDGHHSRVSAGAQRGQALGDLWRSGALGGSGVGGFPFLLKWLDTNDYLSVQVHPDEACVRRFGRGRAKSEAWLVVHREPDARIYLGHRAGLDAEALRRAAGGESLRDWLLEIRPQVGDLIPVAAGTLHAIGPGYLLLEVQQPSDTTFRVHDWGRLGADGRPRELHLEDACRAVHYARSGSPSIRTDALAGPTFSIKMLSAGEVVPAERLRVLVAARGGVELTCSACRQTLEPGVVAVAEPGDGDIEVLSEGCALIGEAP
jgi:mannose-6-phosphate isomerase